jgi:hypothetical protein
VITRSLSPGVRTRATYLNIPRMGHDFLLYPSPEGAFAGNDGRFDPAISDTILGWLRGRRQG